MNGRIYGVAGGSLTSGDTSYAKNQRVVEIGAKAERETAAALEPLARRNGLVVMHDLDVPGGGISANIDHVVIAGRHVLPIDSKAWKPGFYWTLSGHTHRGLSSFKPADKKTQLMIADRLEKYLGDDGIVLMPVLAVWSSSSKGEPTLFLARTPGGRIVHGKSIRRVALKALGTRTPDPRLVERMASLVRS